MSRADRQTDLKLVRAAVALLPETGFSGLKLRRVAARAGVNLGLFPYYFRTKRVFLRRVMQEFYEEFYRGFSLEVAAGEGVEAQLRRALFSLGRFVREHRRLLLALLRDLSDGNPEVLRFAEENFPRHVGILVRLVRKAQAQGVLRKLPIQVTLPFLVGGLLAPNLIAAMLERLRLRPPYEVLKRALLPSVVTERTLALRIELALRALAPVPGPRAARGPQHPPRRKA
jgi:AcrR family transcriptional regulator